MSGDLKQGLQEFVRFSRTLRGDEKSEAQSFLDHFFRALGHPSAIEAGATFEFRIAKKPGTSQLELLHGDDAVKAKGGKKYGDLVWPGRVLIEMKSRGENLEKHYDQLFCSGGTGRETPSRPGVGIFVSRGPASCLIAEEARFCSYSSHDGRTFPRGAISDFAPD